MTERILAERNRVVRHGLLELAEHWAIALSGLVLLLSGLFQMPVAGRYGINQLPGLAWSTDYFASLAVHYWASVVFVAASLFHLVHHGLAGDRGLLPREGDLKASFAVIPTFFGWGKEPPFGKYLPEQRLAYLGMAGIIALLILSGLVKTYKNLYAPDLWYPLVAAATWLHNLGFVLFTLAFIGHIGAILLKPNRPLARGIFTGVVRLDYARHRHPLWLAEIEGGVPGPAVPIPEAAPSTQAEGGKGHEPPGEATTAATEKEDGGSADGTTSAAGEAADDEKR